MESSTRKLLLIVGVVAAAAGVAVATYLYVDRRRGGNNPPLRNVSEVLADCYDRMREIQRNLTELHPSAAANPSSS